VSGSLAAAGFGAGFFAAAGGLFEEGGEDAGEGTDEGDEEEDEAHGAPEGLVAGGAGLLGDVGVRDAAGDEREGGERGGENVEVAGHLQGSRFEVRGSRLAVNS